MTSRIAPALLALLLAGAGCSGISVSIDHDPQADFSKRKTFDWFPQAPAKDAVAVVTLTKGRVERALEEALKARGLTRSAAGKPDLHIAYRAMVDRRVDVSHSYDPGPYGYGWRRTYAGGGTTEVRTYDEGALVVDMIDPDTKTLLWQGTAKGVVDPDRSPEEREAKIREAVGKLLADFPPSR